MFKSVCFIKCILNFGMHAYSIKQITKYMHCTYLRYLFSKADYSLTRILVNERNILFRHIYKSKNIIRQHVPPAFEYKFICQIELEKHLLLSGNGRPIYCCHSAILEQEKTLLSN